MRGFYVAMVIDNVVENPISFCFYITITFGGTLLLPALTLFALGILHSTWWSLLGKISLKQDYDIERVNALWRQLCAVSSLGGLMLSQNAPHLRPLLPLLIQPCPFRLPTEICVLSCTMHAHAQTCTYTHTQVWDSEVILMSKSFPRVNLHFLF